VADPRIVPVGDVIDYAIGGGWGAGEPSDDTMAVAVVRGADFPDVALRRIDGLPIRHESTERVAPRLLQPGDIVLEISGGTAERPTGRTVFVTKDMIEGSALPLIPASFCRLVRADRDKVESGYLYYFLQDLYARGGTWEFQNQSTGLSNFQFELFRRRCLVSVRPLAEQRAIAEVLGALDNKIAANVRLRTSTPALGEALFHRALSAEKPEVVRLQDIAMNVPGRFLARDEYEGGGSFYVYGSNSIMGKHNQSLVDGRFSVLARIGSYCGSLRWSQRPAWINNNASAIVPIRGFEPSVLRYVLNRINMSPHRAGSGQPFIRIDSLFASQVAVPVPRQRKAITPLLDAQAERATVAAEENETLAATRDALLPALMSGKLRVRDAERAVESVV
jgi:type I restriction enzyme S subunit